MADHEFFLNYIPELNYSILAESDDETLLRICRVNSYAAQLCNNDEFWHNRIIKRFGPLIKYRTDNTTWKTFYQRLVNDAMYTVDTSFREVFVYSGIVDAYNKFWSVVAGRSGMTVKEVQDLGFVDDVLMCYIKLAFKGEVTPNDDDFIIYDSKHTGLDFLEYPDLPALNVKNRDLFFYAGSRFISRFDPITNRMEEDYDDDTLHNEFRGVFDYNDAVLHSFMSYTPSYKPNYPHHYDAMYWILRMDTGTSGREYRQFKYGYVTAQTMSGDEINENRIIVLIDTSFFGSSAGFISETLRIRSSFVDTEVLEDLVVYIENKYKKMYSTQ